MKTVLALVVLYQGAIGVLELVDYAMSNSSGGSNSAIASISGLPSVASLIDSSGSMGELTDGVIDLAVAGAVYVFFLHKHLTA